MSTPSSSAPSPAMDRRSFVAFFSSVGLSGTLLPGVLWARAQEGPITATVLAEAEKVAGLEFTDDERALMLEGLNERLEAFEAIRDVGIPNGVPPALVFEPELPGGAVRPARSSFRPSRPSGVERPADLEAVAFWPVTRLSELIRTRQVTSVELTRMYLDRLERHGTRLECLITLTEDLAMDQARRADAELANGRYRSRLHGIPWGAKDLLSVRGYTTTWGAEPYRSQVIDEDATVVKKLDEAGAVLVAKLTLGALASGDVWYGGRTRNPWNLEQGSSGSSAGSAAATVAGLVGFAIGSETRGSIVSPSTRCGASGLRPTFGRVSRYGAMTLSWSMDKLGPICRSAEDCALVLAAIQGADGQDVTARDVPFPWDAERPLSSVRVGFLASAFDDDESRTVEFDRAALEAVRGLGVEPVPVELPGDFPVDSIGFVLNAESAAAFDELTRTDRDDLLVRQTANAWPNRFRSARMIPAVEYIQANRIRTMIMHALNAALDGIDVFVAPSFAPGLVGLTNLTGHPVAVVPSGFTAEGTPVSISFVGNLWCDAEAVLVARAYQEATGWHERVPEAFAP